MLRLVQSLKIGVHKTWLQCCAGSIWLAMGLLRGCPVGQEASQ